MATTDDELVVYHSADEFESEWYDTFDVDEYGTPNWTKLFLPHRNDHDYRIDPLRSSDRLSS